VDEGTSDEACLIQVPVIDLLPVFKSADSLHPIFRTDLGLRSNNGAAF